MNRVCTMGEARFCKESGFFCGVMGRRGSDFFDDVGDNPPDDEVIFGGDFDGLVFVVGREEPDDVLFDFEGFDGEFAVDVANGNLTGCGGEISVDDQDVAIGETGVDHGVTADAGEEGGTGIGDEVLVEVDGVLEVVVGRGRESGFDVAHQGSGRGGFDGGREDAEVGGHVLHEFVEWIKRLFVRYELRELSGVGQREGQ